MKFTGQATLAAPPDQVWAAIHDPAVLARTLPGCSTLTTLGEHSYAMTVTAGVAAVKGTYDGTVALSNQQPHESLTLRAKGSGTPGTIDATVAVRLAPADAGTLVTYDADAIVGGVIGGVGQRMLAGVSRKMAGEFFGALDRDIAGGPESSEGVTPAPSDPGRTEWSPVGLGSRGGPASNGGAVGVLHPGRVATANANAHLSLDNASGFVAGVGLGAVLALVGVAVGARIARRP